MRLCLSMPISLPPGQDTRPTLSGILPGLGLAGIGGGGSGQQESRTDWQCAVVYATSTDLRHSGTMSLNRPIKTEERTEDCEKIVYPSQMPRSLQGGDFRCSRCHPGLGCHLFWAASHNFFNFFKFSV